MYTGITQNMIDITEAFASEVVNNIPVVFPASVVGKYIIIFVGLGASVRLVSLVLFPSRHQEETTVVYKK